MSRTLASHLNIAISNWFISSQFHELLYRWWAVIRRNAQDSHLNITNSSWVISILRFLAESSQCHELLYRWWAVIGRMQKIAISISRTLAESSQYYDFSWVISASKFHELLYRWCAVIGRMQGDGHLNVTNSSWVISTSQFLAEECKFHKLLCRWCTLIGRMQRIVIYMSRTLAE